MWCLLAFVGLALCRLAAVSDDADALELHDRVVALELHAVAQQTAGVGAHTPPRHREPRRASG